MCSIAWRPSPWRSWRSWVWPQPSYRFYRVLPERYQESLGLFHDQPVGVHVPGCRRGGLQRRDIPSDDPCLLQRASLSRRRECHARPERRIGYEKDGGLRKKIPITFWTFFIATLAIAGVPGLSGFFSKDEILWQAFSSSHGHWLLWVVAALAAGMTAFYMFRALFMTFFGESRVDEHVAHHIHESPKIMTVPLMVLAVLSIIGGYIGVPHVLGGANHIHEFLAPVLGGGAEPAKAHAGISLLSQAWASGGEAGGHSAALEIFMMAVSVVIALIGIGIAYLFYVKNPALPKLWPRSGRDYINWSSINIMLTNSMKSSSSTLSKIWALASGRGLMNLSSMARSTALLISSACSPA